MLRSTKCSDWLIILLAYISGKLKLVAVLVLVVRTPEAVNLCFYCLVFFAGSLSAFASVIIDSLAPELTSALTSRVLDCLSFLPAGITSLTTIIGLKLTCFILFLDLVCLSFLLVGFRRVFNRLASCNALSDLLEIRLFSLSFYLLLVFNLSIINTSLQPSIQLLSSLLMELLLILSSSAEYEP